MSTKLIPSQENGKSVDLREEITANDDVAAKKIFQDAVFKLSRPSTWHDTAGKLSASFTIDGKEEMQSLQKR